MTGSIEFVKKRKINDNVYRILVPVRSVKSIIGPVSIYYLDTWFVS